MANFRFLHAADIHLDSPLHGLGRYEGVPVEEVRGATRAAFDQLIQRAIDERVDFVVIAGDLFDGDWKDMGTGLYFCAAMGRLNKAAIPVFLLAGNHDAASVLSRSLPWPPNVHQFGSRRPETHRLPGYRVAIHGQSFALPAVTENLVTAYPPAEENSFNIGVLHTALAGREGHLNYAPCDVDDLRAKRYDYWALGHVHNFEVACTDPYIVFPGNIQGRNIRESGRKGAVLVDVVDRGIASVEPIDLAVLHWKLIEVKCDGAGDIHSLIRSALINAHSESADGKPIVARLLLHGERRDAEVLRERSIALRDEVRGIALSVSPDLWIEKVQVQLRPIESEMPAQISDELSLLIGEACEDPGLGQVLREDLGAFISTASAALGQPTEDDALRLAASSGDWNQILREATKSLRRSLAAEA